MVSNNKHLLDAIDPTLPLITYDKKSAPDQTMSYNNFAEIDTKSFNSPIGGITNLASNFIAMMSNFETNSEEYKELERRVKILRRYQGDSIDASKGISYDPPPKHWKKKQKYIPITEDMSDEEINDIEKQNKIIQFNNRICSDKKAYFFGHVYPDMMKEHNRHKKAYDQLCKQNLGIRLKDLQNKTVKNEEETSILRKYYRYMPLLNNNCTMNVLAKYIESIEFNNMWKKSENFDFTIYYSESDFKPNKKTIDDMIKAVKHMNRLYKSVLETRRYMDKYELDSDMNDFEFLYQEFESNIISIVSNQEEAVNYLVYIYYSKLTNISKTMLWNVFGEQIVLNLKNKTDRYMYPIESDDGEEILGRKYKLVSSEVIKD